MLAEKEYSPNIKSFHFYPPFLPGNFPQHVMIEIIGKNCLTGCFNSIDNTGHIHGNVPRLHWSQNIPAPLHWKGVLWKNDSSATTVKFYTDGQVLVETKMLQDM